MSAPDPATGGSNDAQIAAARVALLKQLAHRAFSHKAQWPSQLSNALVLSGLISPQPVCDDANLAEILSTATHNARAVAFPSPVFVYRDGENSFSVADLTGLFLATASAVRAGAAQETRRLWQFLDLPISADLEASLLAVTNESDAVWRPAAIRLRQFFDAEFLIVGFAYVHYEHIGVDAFVADRVNATFSDSPAVRGFLIRAQQRLSAPAPAGEPGAARPALPDWAITDLLADTGAYALGGLRNAGRSAMEFARSRLVPDGGQDTWHCNSVTSLLSLLKDEPDDSAGLLALLQRLAAHYVRVLECTFPGISQTLATNAAWTMANFLATVNLLFAADSTGGEPFPSSVDALQEYRVYWQYSKPTRSISTAYAFTEGHIPPLALDLVLKLKEVPSGAALPDQTHWPAITAFLAYMLLATATNESSPQGPLFTQVSEITQHWITVVPDSGMSSGLLEIQSQVSFPITRTTLLDAYRELPTRSSVTHDAALQLILTGIKRGQLTLNDLLELWQDGAWRTALSRADFDVIQRTIAVCLSALDPSTSDVGVSFCHLLAEFTLSLREDTERFKALVSMLIVASVRSNTTSAVERLAAKCRGTEAIAVIQSAAEFLESHEQTAPSWLAGRMRAVLSSVKK